MIHKNCHRCGHRYEVLEWPRKCAECDEMTWRNPTPVVVIVVPVRMQSTMSMLVERRGIEPGKGELALVSGYMDFGETWEEAAVREIKEEIGLVVDPAKFTQLHVCSNTSRSSVLIFCVSPSVAERELQAFEPNEEVTEIVLTTEPLELAFDSHTEALREVLAGYGYGVVR